MAETDSSAAAVAVTVSATQPEHVTANVVTSGSAPNAEKTSESSSTPKEQSAVAPKPAAATASNPEPTKTPKTDTPNPSTTAGSAFQSKGDDFYNSIFYFSGMGSVIGSALSHGVYVSDQNRRNAVDPDDVGGKGGGGGRQTEQLVVCARGQAQNLSTDFHKLQSLLESLPVFTGVGGSSAAAAADRRNEPDQPIHGELYFRCKERFPVQPSPTPTSQLQTGRERPRSRASEAEERGRRRYDDAVLDEVTRAAVDAFPLLPPTRGVGSSPASSGRASPYHGGERRRRPAPPGQSDWTTETVDVRPWQMSHVRQYDVIDGYPVHRP